jgi:ABC-type branched-subunit amino acid transport system substrate-binding protein
VIGSGVKVLAAATAMAFAVAACGSSSSKASGGSSSGSVGSTGSSGSASGAYKIGLIADFTGLSSSTGTGIAGVKAALGLATQEGYHFDLFTADTATTPSGALAAAHKLVEQDHVFAVFAESALTFAAAPYLASQGVPVVGFGLDGPEWATTRTMFNIEGPSVTTKVSSAEGNLFKLLGVTNFAAIGLGVSPAAGESAEGAAVSAQEAGIKVGYLNANFPFGSTNVTPEALAMKSAGVNGLYAAVNVNTEFAMVEALDLVGVKVKAQFPISDGDLLSSGPNAARAAQGQYFTLGWEPIELHTAATERFEGALQKYGGTSAPTLYDYGGYVTGDLFVTGLKGAGAHPTQAQFINAMLGIRSYNAAGLLGTHTIGMAMDQRGLTSGYETCEWVTQYSGSTFNLVPGAEPVCGSTIPGKTVKPPA